MTPEIQSALDAQASVNNEFFFWMSTALMFAIHAGFLAYEAGASRAKNVLASSMKNLLTLGVVVSTFYFVGWFLYNAMPTGVPRLTDAAKAAVPWSANMGPNTDDAASGIFYAAFALFAATTASILSGAVLERIRTSAFLILAACVGSVVWIIGAAWGWHGNGWLLTELGFHDVGATGAVHMVAGFFALGVLLNLGPRVGRFNADGSANTIRPHNLPLTMLGLMLIFLGFFGFLMGCAVYSGGGYSTIYASPTNLSAYAFNTLMGLGGGIIGAYIASRGEPFWTISGGLAGMISVGAGLDLYYPGLAFLVALFGGAMIPYLGRLIERFGIDDVVGAFTVHGGCGLLSLVASGIFLHGYPNVDNPEITLWGQLLGAVVYAALGFVPGFAVSWVLSKAGMLRIPAAVEEEGLDLHEVPADAYPEGFGSKGALPGLPSGNGAGAGAAIPGAVPVAHRQSNV